MPLTSSELFDVYEPVPAQCLATVVTLDNIHTIAMQMRGKVEYDAPTGAGATLHLECEPDEKRGVEGWSVTVHTGEMLVLHRGMPGVKPLVLNEGWNAVPDPWEFQRQWRKVAKHDG